MCHLVKAMEVESHRIFIGLLFCCYIHEATNQEGLALADDVRKTALENNILYKIRSDCKPVI